MCCFFVQTAFLTCAGAQRLRIIGIDLAWGDRNSDGICLLEVASPKAFVSRSDLVQGDDQLMDWVQSFAGGNDALVMIDAPLICPNATGCRAVDKQITSMFGRYHAGCHPANSKKCSRPLRIAAMFRSAGFRIGYDLSHRRLVAEVYPHPATVRLFGLERIIKYKRPPVANRRSEFSRLQECIRKALESRFPEIEVDSPVLSELLRSSWNKPVEDRTDALLCALIGYNHFRSKGADSEIVGDLSTGFILLPR